MNSRKIPAPCCKPAKAFYLSASVCFVLLAFLLLFSQDAFSGHYFQPKLLAVTHLAALGWGTLLIFGICCQKLPHIFKTGFFNLIPIWASLIFFLAGLSLLVYSFWKFLPGLPMQLGSLLVFTAILLFAIQVLLSAKISRENSLQQEYITTAFIWLIVTALLGVLMVFNFRFAFLPKDHLDFLRIHAHTGILGWFLFLIIGLSIHSDSLSSSNKLLSAAYYSLNIALLLFLVDTYFSGINLKTYAVLLIGFAGLTAYLLFIFKNFRQKKPAFFSVLSPILLMLAALLIPFIIHYSLKSEPSAVRLTAIYGILIFMGWITAFVFSYTFENYLIIRKKGFKVFYALSFILFFTAFFSGWFLDYKALMISGITCLILISCFYFYEITSSLKRKDTNRGEGEK